MGVKEDSSAADLVRLGRAAREWRLGNLRGVVENLEPLDFTAPSFSEADRAAFLLGQAYLRLGQRARFERLARTVTAWKITSLYRDWMEFELAWRGGEAADSTSLASVDTSTALGRDLAGVVALGRATGAMDRNQDPTPWLDAVPAGSRYAAAARHVRGRLALERGDLALASSILTALVEGDTAYAGRREAWLALAGIAIERGQWSEAARAYDDIDRDWTAQNNRIARLLEQNDLEGLWRAWESSASDGDAWRLDTKEARSGSWRLADASTDLGRRPAAGIPGLGAWLPGRELPPAPAPDADAWRAVETSATGLEEAAATLTRTRWELERERERLAAQRQYLGYGGEQVDRIALDLTARAARLDSLKAAIEALVLELRSVRDSTTRRVVSRATEVLASCERSLTWIHAMVHFHLSGPERERTRPMPPGIPSRDVLLAEEEALTRAILALAEDIAQHAPGLIARSHDDAWGPSLVDRILSQSEEARRSLAWARALGKTVDSTRALATTSDTLRALTTRVAVLERELVRRHADHLALRDRIARETLRRSLAALAREREAIEYGLAVSAYGVAVHLMPAGGDSSRVGKGTPDLADSEDADSITTLWRARAMARHRGFLTSHPQSFARGEMRFRLADLELVDARHRFRERMAAYVKAQSEGRAAGLALPVLTYAPALALYRALLAEDPEFAHRDAALFNAGMILADGGDPEAMRFFGELVLRHPDSRYAQESHLRMGDLDFDGRRFPAAVVHYAKAAEGADPNLSVIALYKMGWAHYNEDRFPEAADAFRAVLDRYASQDRAQIQADIEREAETYLVHSLAGAGGSKAVLAYFEKIGARPYERRVLMSLAQHFRRYGKLAEAAEADELCLQRYPEHADALTAAERLIETRLRSGDAAAVRDARLKHAATFAPGSRWAKAQASDSVRAAGEAFARNAWTTVADEHHRAARAGGSQDDWRQALALYDQLLEHWPDGDEGARLRMRAGEASTALGSYAGAIRHYELAAKTGSDSLAAAALWQRVAVTDQWYGTTRAGADRSATGSDSLAREVRRAADALLDRFPGHPQAAQLAWRRGQLAYAHGWYADAAKDFESLTKSHPGDRRVPDAAVMRADALYRLDDFDGAGAAWEDALQFAKAAGRDSLVRRAAAAIPVCAYRHAEQAVAKDSTDYARHAPLFENVATRWPGYENAHAAQYRAGLAYFKAGKTAEGALAMAVLIERFPKSTFVRDAHLEIARGWEAGKEPARAADAYVKFASRYPADPSAKDAWLKAADLLDQAGQAPRAEELRLAFLGLYPNDFESAMEILEPLARRDLAGVGPGHPISTLLPAPKKAAKGAKAPKAGASTTSSSHLASYLKLAAAHPELASRSVLGQVEFLKGEEANAKCEAARLRLPLAPSIAARQKLLNDAIAAYKKSVEIGVPEWAHASTFRMGEALVAFGQALERSERPADLTGDDLLAYEDVLIQQGEVFAARGETVWSELLRQKAPAAESDPWIARAQTALWQRLGNRFFYRPEVEYPVLKADAPDRKHAEAPESTKAGRTRKQRAADARDRDRTTSVAQKEASGR